MGLFSNLIGRISRAFTPSKASSPVQAIPQQQQQPKETPEQRDERIRQKALDAEKEELQRYLEWFPIASSWIAALRYDYVHQVGWMRVKKGGKVYQFGRMGKGTFLMWVRASSPGAYFNDFLKGKYTVSTLTGVHQTSSYGPGIRATEMRSYGVTPLAEYQDRTAAAEAQASIAKQYILQVKNAGGRK